MIVHIREPKNYTRKLLEIIKFSNELCYKINSLLSTKGRHKEKEIMDILLFTIYSKETRYLEIKLSKEVNELHSENI